MAFVREPLSREEFIVAVERRGSVDRPARVPVIMAQWWGVGTREKYGACLDRLAATYPEDALVAWHIAPGEDLSTTANPAYRWGYRDYTGAVRHSIGRSAVLLPDWGELDRLLADFPDPDEPGVFDAVATRLTPEDNRYRLGGFWRLFHERFWSIRGMENLMYDYADYPGELRELGEHLLAYYQKILDRYAALGFDGILVSDDLGHQRGPMMSPDTFSSLYLPLYEAFVRHAHAVGLHVFLHSCGDNAKLMDFLVAAGIDVFHPVQKGCMDMQDTSSRYGDKLSFLVGMDVQHILPEGTPGEVREEVRRLKAVFARPEGGCLLAAGNGILPDTPIENLEAFLSEAAL